LAAQLNFERAFAAHDQMAGGPAWLQSLRKSSYADFSAQGLPTRRHEDWKYTSLKPLTERAYVPVTEAPTIPGLDLTDLLAAHVGTDDIALVFVDGQLATSHSRLTQLPEGIRVLSLADASDKRKDVINGLLALKQPSTGSPLELLSRAFLGAGAYIEVDAGRACERLIHVVHVSTRDAATFPRTFFVAGASSETRLAETYVGLHGLAYFVSPATDISLAQGAQVAYCKAIVDGDQPYHVGATRVSIARDARFQSFAFGLGGRLSRSDLDVALLEPGASAAFDGLYMAKGKQHVDNHTTVDHRVPDAASEQLYKGILDGEARAVFNGKVFVRRDAQHTAAQQLNKNLLLSTECEIDTKPELQIDADDVKCTHGAAIGRLNRDEIFYLQSRGIDEVRAEKLLTRAYAEDVIRRFGVEAVEDRLMALTERFFA